MRSKTIMTLSIIMLIIADNLHSQYITHHDLTVTLTAEVTHVDTFFYYQYLVSNNSTSNQPLEVLRLEVGDRSSNAGGTLADFTAPAHWVGWTDKVVPVPRNLLARCIAIWDISDSIASIDDLYSPPDIALFPGASFNVSFKSTGLPHIMRFLARGWARPLTTIEYDSLRAIGMPHSEIIKPWYHDAFIGKTISPVIPRTPFNGFAYLDTLKSYINQSRSLGWITNDPTANKYSAFIDSARSNLQANRRGVTKANLDMVLQNVDADSGSTLTSEAYALLRFNTEYVLNKLREYEPER